MRTRVYRRRVFRPTRGSLESADRVPPPSLPTAREMRSLFKAICRVRRGKRDLSRRQTPRSSRQRPLSRREHRIRVTSQPQTPSAVVQSSNNVNMCRQIITGRRCRRRAVAYHPPRPSVITFCVIRTARGCAAKTSHTHTPHATASYNFLFGRRRASQFYNAIHPFSSEFAQTEIDCGRARVHQ